MQYRVNSIDAKHFTPCRSMRTLITEASELHGYRLKERLYSDAADVGFGIFNLKTGETSRWVFEGEKRAEGDLLVCYYVPTKETLEKHPQLQGWKVHILND